MLLGFSRRRLELIVAQLGEPRGEPQAILDVGSGSGRLAGLLLADHPQWHATLADHSAEALRFARAYIECRGWAGRARCVRGSLGALPFAAQAFDVVIAAEVLEHASDPQASVADLLRVLKPGGRLVISLPINLGIAMHPTVFETAQDILNFFGRPPLALLLSERVAPDSALDAISDVFPGFEGCLNLVLEHRPTQP